MASIAILGPGDEPALGRFLAGRPYTTMFLRSNLRQAGLVDAGQTFQGTYAAALRDGEVVGVAALYWNGMVIVEAPEQLAEIVRAAAAAVPRAVTGLLGPWPQVVAARDALHPEGRAARLESKEDLFVLELGDLAPPPPLGQTLRCRRARLEDLDLLGAWRHAYHLEALHEPDRPGLLDECRDNISALIGRDDAYVVEDAAGGPPLAMSAFNARLPDTVQIGGVYTPPAQRGRGLARAAVAGSLVDARAAGIERAILFTGDDNHPAQRAYLAIGFRIVGDYGMIRFA